MSQNPVDRARLAGIGSTDNRDFRPIISGKSVGTGSALEESGKHLMGL
jgi:hypothetical protein